MKDIELRFVEREMTKPIGEGIAEIYMGKILQFRKLKSMAFNADYDKWTEWQDVPLEQEEV
jgi:hypothetical protein